ncbi:MAG: glycoside hydrolase family 13 protein [Oscillospiraceae bacterium]|nr:glycoside hydrolase family 13 protein [Oscillospiraceae bacterium]
MFDLSVYDPWKPDCKQPYGAVTSGTQVRFALRPLSQEGFSRVRLIARFEFWENRVREVDMTWRSRTLGRDLFEGSLFTEGYVGLIWYHFSLEGLDGRTETSPVYQLTVYDGTERVPDWFGQGMCYQIFPDRFRRTELPDPAGMVGGRWVHENWEDLPQFEPNEHGEVRNRDFFGGSLKGVEEKLDYLRDLGVSTIYFCPIFEAAENHRYGTGDYSRIDPMLGTNEDFSRLCSEAHKRGMRVMLDGVFNHTGFVSRYFNGDGSYPDVGAYQSTDSPYSSWFHFQQWPHKYDSWWGIYSLSAVNEHDPSYRRFMFGGPDSVVRRWLRAGADGWRLDVADELPDDFVEGVRAAVRAEKPNAAVIGEVWEDGTTKIAYGVRRKHLLGGHLDGLMNYPFRNAAISFLLGGDAQNFYREMEQLRENYPPFAFYSSMNSLGTHDTLRILTLLGVGSDKMDETKGWRSRFVMTPEQRELGLRRLKVGAVLLFAFPGAPTVYYGDEAGMEGFEDPFNRRGYPWGKENQDLIQWFSKLGKLRKRNPCLRKGTIEYIQAEGHVLAFTRRLGRDMVLAAMNAGDEEAILTLDWMGAVDLLSGKNWRNRDGALRLRLPPCSGTLLFRLRL